MMVRRKSIGFKVVYGILVPKKGLEPFCFGSTFRFNEIPLSIEYTSLRFFSIHSTASTHSTCSTKSAFYVDTTLKDYPSNYGHHGDGTGSCASHIFRSPPIRDQITPIRSWLEILSSRCDHCHDSEKEGRNLQENKRHGWLILVL